MSDEVLSAERIAYQATTHECGWAEHHINALVESKVAEALAQAQASLAAARAQLPEESDRTEWQKKEINSWLWWYHQVIELFNNGEPKDFDALLQEGPQSKNLSLAKLLAEERLPLGDALKLIRGFVTQYNLAGLRAHKDSMNPGEDLLWKAQEFLAAARVAELKGEQK